VLACAPWLFNVNFYYLPAAARTLLAEAGMATDGSTEESKGFELPDAVGEMLEPVAVDIKLAMQVAGEALVPFQPIAIQRAQAFRIVMAGDRSDFTEADLDHLLDTIERYGALEEEAKMKKK
jgi:hypothetical protein